MTAFDPVISASRSSKPRDVRPTMAATPCARIHRLTLFETAGCATESVTRDHKVAFLPPHALRNRGMCDVFLLRIRLRRLPRLTLFETAGCATERRRRRRGYFARPPHALRNRGMCDVDNVGPTVGASPRLTLFETAGCATLPFGRARSRHLPASRSSKPRDVRPRAPRLLAAMQSRLTLFETAGCATSWCGVLEWVAIPPHALRNRGMCDSVLLR